MLDIGESITTIIYANKLWNGSSIRLIPQQQYRFSVDPSDTWIDGTITCNANGFDSNTFDRWWLKPFEWSKRVPNRNWFELIGAFDLNPQRCFSIGTERTLTVTDGGLLTCFANDAHTMYWNNKGFVTLRVTRLR